MELICLFDGLTKGDPEDKINRVPMLPLDFCNGCEESFDDHGNPYIDGLFEEMQKILAAYHIPLPDISAVEQLPLCRKRTKASWEGFGDSSSLSIILHQKTK